AGAIKGVCAELSKANVHVLDGDHYVYEKTLGVAGIKGFGGGFGRATLQAFGEGPTKAFVQEGVSESLKLEAALGQLETPKKVVMRHYRPIADTCLGGLAGMRTLLRTRRR